MGSIGNAYPSFLPQSRELNNRQPVHLPLAQRMQKSWWKYSIRYRISQNCPSCPEPSDDQAVSSGGFSRDLKDGYLRILRQVCHFHNVLPTSYTALGVISVEERAFALGIFADIYKGQLEAGNPVRIKVFRTQNPSNMENIKCVCALTVSGEINSDNLF